MAYRIKRGEELRHAVKRMAHRELGEARDALSDRRGAAARDGTKRGVIAEVHDVRTALKKTRALIRLVGPAVDGAARDADQDLRGIGRRLSKVRDSEVLLETFDRLRRSIGARDDGELADARHALEGLLREQVRALSAAERRALSSGLGRARREVADWAPKDDRWRNLARGLFDGYRRCRQRMRTAYDEETAAAFHAWRRAVKTHRYQIQVFAPLWPDELETRRSGLERIGDLLGEEHDLATLAETLHDERVCVGDDAACRKLLAALEKRQHELRLTARPLGARLFAEKPGAFARRFHAYFRSFQREEPGIAEEAVHVHP